MKYIILLFWPGSVLTISLGTFYTLVKVVHVSHTGYVSCPSVQYILFPLFEIPAHPPRLGLVVSYSNGVECTFLLPQFQVPISEIALCHWMVITRWHLSLLACQLNSYRIDSSHGKDKNNVESHQAMSKFVEFNQLVKEISCSPRRGKAYCLPKWDDKKKIKRWWKLGKHEMWRTPWGCIMPICLALFPVLPLTLCPAISDFSM